MTKDILTNDEVDATEASINSLWTDLLFLRYSGALIASHRAQAVMIEELEADNDRLSMDFQDLMETNDD